MKQNVNGAKPLNLKELAATLDKVKEERDCLMKERDELRMIAGERQKRLDELLSKQSNCAAISVQDVPRHILGMIRSYQPEQQNMIIGKVIMELSVEKSQIVKEAKEHLNRSEESLSQFLLVANGSKYAEVKA